MYAVCTSTPADFVPYASAIIHILYMNATVSHRRVHGVLSYIFAKVTISCKNITFS